MKFPLLKFCPTKSYSIFDNSELTSEIVKSVKEVDYWFILSPPRTESKMGILKISFMSFELFDSKSSENESS